MATKTIRRVVPRQARDSDGADPANFPPVYQDDSQGYLSDMDVHSIRLANLEHLQHGLERKDLATKIGVDYGQLGHYYTGVRNIGSRIARKIEQAFGKPHGWLDQPHPELRIAKRASTKGVIAEPGRG